MRSSLSLAILALALAVPAAASAQISDADKATARTLAQEGQDALDKRDFAKAADRFGRASELVHAPTLLLGLARAQVGLGKWVAAAETYNRLVREPVAAGAPAPFVKANADARKELAQLEPRIPSVTIVVNAPSPRVTLDGTPVPAAALGVARPVDPGDHVLRAEADGFAPAQTSFKAVEHHSDSVTLKLDRSSRTAPPEGAPLPPVPPPPVGASGPAKPPIGTAEPPPPPPPPPASSSASLRRTLGFAGIGVGGAGLILGGVTGGLAMPKHSALAKVCSDGHCPTSQASALGDYHRLTTISTAGFIAGGVLAAAGIVLVVTAPAKTTTSAGVAPVLGVGNVGAVGWF